MIRALVIGLAVITCTAAQSQNLETDTMRDWTVVRGTSGQGCFATMSVGLKAWQYCTPETCVASGGVSEAELNKLRAGRRVFLGFVPLPGSAPLITPVSLLGITRAWNAVQDCS